MNNQWKNMCLGLALFALTFVASASAQEWNAPATSADSAAQTFLEGSRSHTVTLNRVGQLEGRITSGDQTGELNVYFVRDGKIVTRTTTHDSGYFTAQDIGEGNYSFIATDQRGFVAYGLQVKPYDQSAGINAIEAATVSTGYKGIQRILKNSVPSQIAAEISGVDQPAASSPAFAGSNVVNLVNGQLRGQVASVDSNRQPVYGTEVFIIQNDREIARTTADAAGNFTFQNFNAGIYDFIAAASNGIAAVQFQAVNTESVLDQTDPNGFQPVSFRKSLAPAATASLQVCLTCESDSDFVGEQIDYAANDAAIVDSVPSEETSPIEYASESLGCGCASGGSCSSCGNHSGAGAGFTGSSRGLSGGGSFGGGARLGGGGRFGRLLSLGGLAGLAGIDSDSDSTPAQATPSTTN